MSGRARGPVCSGFRGLRAWSASAVALAAALALAPSAASQTILDLKPQAEAGSADAQVTLGEAYYYGSYGATRDYAEALVWFLKAAEQGNVAGMEWAASIYRGMQGVAPNPSEALRLYNTAISLGSAAAASNLGSMYEEGNGVEPDLQEARRLYRIALDRRKAQAATDGYQYGFEETALQRVERLIVEGATVGFYGTPPGDPPDEILPGEVAFQTANGCRGYVRENKTYMLGLPVSDGVYSWTGGCRFGLLHGQGNQNDLPATYTYGRRSDSVVEQDLFSADGIVLRPDKARSLTVSNLNTDNLDAPVWPSGSFDTSESRLSLYSLTTGESVSIQTQRPTCSDRARRQMNREQKRAIANIYCESTGGDPIYAVEVMIGNAKGEYTHDVRYCPDPTTTSGCAWTWKEALAPYRQNINAVISDSVAILDAEDALIKKFEEHEASLKRWEEGKKSAADRYAKRLQDERDKAKQAAAAEAAQAQQAAAQAELVDSLKGLNPGQMLAKADELEQAGRIEDARFVRRQMISRFPDHPLSAIAAQKLTSNTSPPSGPVGASVQKASVDTSQPTTVSPVPAVDDGLVEVRLADRWEGVVGTEVLARIAPEKYDQIEAKRKACYASNVQNPGCDPPDFYDYALPFQNPYKLYESLGKTYPNCKYSPQAAHSLHSIAQRQPERTCAYLLQQAVHEAMETEVTAMRAGEGLLNSAKVEPMPGTTTGNCEADFAALQQAEKTLRSQNAIEMNASSMVRLEQLTMYLLANRYRVLTTSCKGTPRAEGAAELRQLAGASKKMCEAFATNPAECVPRIP